MKKFLTRTIFVALITSTAFAEIDLKEEIQVERGTLLALQLNDALNFYNAGFGLDTASFCAHYFAEEDVVFVDVKAHYKMSDKHMRRYLDNVSSVMLKRYKIPNSKIRIRGHVGPGDYYLFWTNGKIVKKEKQND